jgi:hypothetical protein
MEISEAMFFARQQTFAVRRVTWHRSRVLTWASTISCYIWDTLVTMEGFPISVIVSDGEPSSWPSSPYVPSIEDLLADDWENIDISEVSVEEYLAASVEGEQYAGSPTSV